MRPLGWSIAALLASAYAAIGGTLILKLGWVDKGGNRATIDAVFVIDHAHKKANAGAQDGDLHIAGRAPKEVGLPMVAEIMNAGTTEEKAAVDLVHSVETSGKSSKVTGVWRVWFEHPGEQQVQFAKVEPAENTNPDHSFEIHPVTNFGGQDLVKSFHKIKDFDPKDAAAAFKQYEAQEVSIKATKTAVTLDAKKVGFNYVAFKMRLIGAPKELADGRAAMADVFPLKGGDEDVLAVKIRMIFVKGTPPWELLSGKGDGDEFEALGIPRVDLNQIFTFASKAGPAGVKRKLPYELVVVDAKAIE